MQICSTLNQEGKVNSKIRKAKSQTLKMKNIQEVVTGLELLSLKINRYQLAISLKKLIEPPLFFKIVLTLREVE